MSGKGFRARILLSITGVVLLLVLGVIAGLEIIMHRELRRTLAGDVETAAEALSIRLRVSGERLATEARVVSEEPRLKAALTTEGIDRTTLDDIAEELRKTTRWDLVGLLGGDGEIRALRGAPSGAGLGAATLHWQSGDAVFRIARAPVAYGSRVYAVLIAGERVSDEWITEATTGTRAQTVVFSGKTVVAATFPRGSDARKNLAALATVVGGEVEVGGEQFLARLLELDKESGLHALVLRSADIVLAPYYGLRRAVFLMCGAAFLLALLVAVVASGGLSRPVAELHARALTSEGIAERTREEMHRLIDHVPDAICVQSHGRFLYANRAMMRLLGWKTTDDIEGRLVAEVIHPEDRGRFLAFHAAMVDQAEEGSVMPREIRFGRHDGTAVPMEVVGLPIQFGGQPAILNVAHDLTERKLLEARQVADELAAKELEVARQIQAAMVPSADVVDRRFIKLAGYFGPAADCGGDWWTHHDMVGGKLLLMIGDVTGHGVPAAMMTATAKAACDVARVTHQHDIGCAQLLQIMNEAFFQVSGARLFMSCFAALVDPATRTITFANAAHDFPYHVRGVGQELRLSSLVAQGMRLGDSGDARFETKTVALQPGDTIVMYTDGIIEDPQIGRQAGAKRFRELLKMYAHLDPQQMRDSIVGAIEAAMRGQARADDMTLVVAKVY